MSITSDFFVWLSSVKYAIFISRQGSSVKLQESFIEFVYWVNYQVEKNGLLSLEENLHGSAYEKLSYDFEQLGWKTDFIDKTIKLFCDGLYGDDSISIWENYIFYVVDPAVREYVILLVEAIHHIIGKDISFKSYISAWR